MAGVGLFVESDGRLQGHGIFTTGRTLLRGDTTFREASAAALLLAVVSDYKELIK